ncbi:hypothetical protein M9Y10_041513 [Tritrichomonas musculus]|uniref:PPM-type phosphatase domain-containing protein n=1 Tax=Tritrichomonas musculus TaxID=1915356 RepID=A0ABR2K5G9_9EUKA
MSKKKTKDSFVICVGPKRCIYGHAEYKGERLTMEDATIIFGDNPTINHTFFAIYDGHGGSDVSRYAGKHIHESFKKYFLQNQDGDIFAALKKSFQEINNYVIRRWPTQGSVAGVIIVSDDKVYSYNIGDVRAVMVFPDGRYERISHDHRACDPEEKTIIESLGGKVFQNRLQGSLEISRTLGDGEFKKFINTEPFTSINQRIDGAKVILACDGVWDVLNDELVSKIALKHKDPNDAALDIADQAISNHTTDNVSCIVIDLTHIR